MWNDHATQTPEFHISEPLNKDLDQLEFLIGFQQYSHNDLRIIIKESGQEKGFEVTEGIN